ncbi:hypothetical protein NX722_13495 [Endozoicomonas gorgoniicola]|uniref:Uncharacterized protein n=1 Tax=Endozoicomonas gorgoniicola TaxID=1234144 RepID=A0ABT3MW74_9GAMM|nr:hypothetical protein [Endozoicomonas gorgoniicola]MCW7553622.1 hypothetical protein [Endozoicomonas gorgoniicola]
MMKGGFNQADVVSNESTLLELKLELEALQKTRTRTPEQFREKREKLVFIGLMIELIEETGRGDQ